MDRPGTNSGGQPGTRAASPAEEAELARRRQSHVRHELLAPLAVIYPLLSLLLDDGGRELDPQQREYLEMLARSVDRLEALITGVAASGWMDCSAAPSIPGTVVLGDVADELLALRDAEGARGPSIQTEVAAPSPRALADLEDVRMILSGLVRNAAGYTPADGCVSIRAHHKGGDPGTVVLEVEDTGPGIPAQELDQVFEFGFRGELARDLKVPGLGAGLWICRQLARRNAGDLEVTSAPGTGTMARLTLPAVRTDPV